MNNTNPSAKKHQFVLIVILTMGLAFIVAVLLLISLVELSNRETTLLGTVLTLISVGIGWGVSHYYAGEDKKAAVAEIRDFEQRNLRTYALKAAEKVTNLSKELNRLSAYLQEELQYSGYRNADEELFAKEERIESAIHMLESLRSINDTSLSDWQGVIGEELDEQRELAKEQAQALRALSERLSAVEGAATVVATSLGENAEIDEIKKQIRALATDMSGGSFRTKQRPNYQQIESNCPACHSTITYGQRAKEGDRKAIQCKNCSTNLISIYHDEIGFKLKVRESLSESITCPDCSASQTARVDEWPTASTTVVCVSCRVPLRVSRSGDGLRVAAVNSDRPVDILSPEFIEAVRHALPAQPWPKGIHQVVADRLATRPSLVQKAIQHLIRGGIFKDQVDGVVCTTAEKLALFRSVGSDL